MMQNDNIQTLNPNILVTRLENIERHIMHLDAYVRVERWNGREIQDLTKEYLVKQIFLNLFLLSVLAGFSILLAFFEPALIIFTASVGLIGCFYVGYLINKLAISNLLHT